MRIPVILAGAAAAIILARITYRKKKDTHEPGKIEEFRVDNIKPVVVMKTFAEDEMKALKPEKDGPEEIIQIKRLKIPEKLEARYPGLKNIEIKIPVEQR